MSFLSSDAEEGEQRQQKQRIEQEKTSKKMATARRGGQLLRRIGQMRQICVSQEVAIRSRQAREMLQRQDSDFDTVDEEGIIQEQRLIDLADGPRPSDDDVFAAVTAMSVASTTASHDPMPPGLWGGALPRAVFPADDIARRLDEQQKDAGSAPLLSTKMQRLCDMIEQDIRRDHTVKIVVFTSFLAEMDILAREMSRRRIGCTKIHGKLNLLKRSSPMQMFAVPESGVHVLLAQIACMSTGVNLQCANVAYITSPSWNPCTEEQAVGRLHRQGQTRPVTVRRLIMRKSIEMRCLEIQRRKMDVIRSNVERSRLEKKGDATGAASMSTTSTSSVDDNRQDVRHHQDLTGRDIEFLSGLREAAE